jgi:dTMP kinase
MHNVQKRKRREKITKKGFFICVEGLDRCGKTTQSKLLVRKLKKLGYDAVYTAEPSQGKIGRFITKYCLHCRKRISAIAEALLFAADRSEHVENQIMPALNEGKIVVSDRYVHSSLAYQGATGLDLNWIERINEHAIRPDLAIFIDIKPEIVLQKLKPRKSVMEKLETQRRVREVYMKFVKRGDLIEIDGNKTIKKVGEDVLKVVRRFLKR